MATCSVCGSTLSSTIAWCGQCFTPIANMRPDQSYQRTTPRQMTSPVITLPGRDAARRLDHDVVIVPPTPTVTFRPSASRPEPERSSLLHGGPTSLGIVGKLVVTSLLVGIGVGLWFGLETFISELGEPLRALQFAVMSAYALLSLIVLWFTWRPEPEAAQVHVVTGSLRTTPRPDMIRVDPPVAERDDSWS
jgi:ABC-type nitrate/sulfonate/bicarbonate transport system permease component